MMLCQRVSLQYLRFTLKFITRGELDTRVQVQVVRGYDPDSEVETVESWAQPLPSSKNFQQVPPTDAPVQLSNMLHAKLV